MIPLLLILGLGFAALLNNMARAYEFLLLFCYLPMTLPYPGSNFLFPLHFLEAQEGLKPSLSAGGTQEYKISFPDITNI